MAARTGLWFAAALLACLVAAGEAQASLRVCNRTKALMNVAVGFVSGDDFATEGWWSVTPGACATPIRGDLPGRYVYLYGQDIDGVDVLKGTNAMCVDRRKFKAQGIGDCWRRGLLAVNFAEVDTQGEKDWTTFLGR
jgi:uncharacterized membrane protein